MGLPDASSTAPCISSCPAQCVRHSQYMLASPPSAIGIHELTRQNPSGLTDWVISVLPFQQVAVSVFHIGCSLSVRRKSNHSATCHRFS